jgi:hypothetical protein
LLSGRTNRRRCSAKNPNTLPGFNSRPGRRVDIEQIPLILGPSLNTEIIPTPEIDRQS